MWMAIIQASEDLNDTKRQERLNLLSAWLHGPRNEPQGLLTRSSCNSLPRVFLRPIGSTWPAHRTAESARQIVASESTTQPIADGSWRISTSAPCSTISRYVLHYLPEFTSRSRPRVQWQYAWYYTLYWASCPSLSHLPMSYLCF